MLPKRYTCVLFDLDGTLIDSLDGIVSSLKRAIKFFGLPIPDEKIMRSFVGPPLIESFTNILGLSREDAEKAIEIYRENFDIGTKGNPLFYGVRGMLEMLHRGRMPLGIATSKPKTLALQILDSHKIIPYFRAIEGGGPNEEDSEKAVVIRKALNSLRDRGVDITRAVMVGDRCYDSRGAAASGIASITVGWGYASKEELAEEGPVMDTIENLTYTLLED